MAFTPQTSPQVFWQHTGVTKTQRMLRMRQKPMVFWFTGLSGAGKTTLASAVEAHLHAQGHATYMLDGDNLRHGLCGDLGFSLTDRRENVRRTGEVARLMVDAGLIVLVCLISPDRQQRAAVRARFANGEFHEIYISTPLDACERRDPKGLYKLARAGQIAEFTGISSAYDPPTRPELMLDTTSITVEVATGCIADYIFRAQSASPQLE